MATLRTTRPRRATHPLFNASRAGIGLVGWIGLASIAFGQLIDNPDWKETDVPPPPAFSESRLVPIEMPPYMSLKFGVDPATMAVTGDGVVRYVVVASSKSGGAVNAFYEGVRCATAEVKTYARYNSGAWQTEPAPDWKRMSDLNSSYAKALARQGLCRGDAPRASVGEMVRQMKNPVREVE